MQARGHLRLIVSTPPRAATEAPEAGRISLVQPIGRARLRLHWLKARSGAVAICVAAALLLSLGAALALGWV